MNGVSFGPLLLEAPGIEVYQVGAEQLLAMKLSAWRNQQDINDAIVILREVMASYSGKAALWAAILPYVNDMKAQYAFEELWSNVYE